MMVEANRKFGYFVLSVLSVTLLSLPFGLCGCAHKSNVIDTNKMPGHKVSDMLNSTHGTNASKESPLTRTKSGVYIYKDNSTVNTTGYNFHVREKNTVGPNEVTFEAERFRTRY